MERQIVEVELETRPVIEDIVSKFIDQKNKEKLSSEEKLAKRMSEENVWKVGTWRENRTGLVEGETDVLAQR